ncbi:hypothetical protein D3C75_1231070 [compost metagenome]
MHIAAGTESLHLCLFRGVCSQFIICRRLWLLKHGDTFLLYEGMNIWIISKPLGELFQGLISIVADFGGACILRIS